MTVTTTIARIIDDAADMIQPTGRWIRDTEARDDEGTPVDATDPTACQWCALGAIRAVVLRSDNMALFSHTISHLARSIAPATTSDCARVIIEFNDRAQTQAEVVNAFRDCAYRLRLNP